MKAARALACVAAAALLIALIAASARQGLSDLQTYIAADQVDGWTKAKRPVTQEQVVRVMSHLETALDLAPDNAWALEQSAAMHLWRARTVTDPGVAVAASRAGYVNLRRTLVERPSSPFAWASLAHAKQLLDEQDDEFFQALRIALALGPWEQPVLENVMRLGLSAWAKATPTQRANVLLAIEHMGRTQPGKTAQIAKEFSRIDVICDNNAYKIPAGLCAPGPAR